MRMNLYFFYLNTQFCIQSKFFFFFKLPLWTAVPYKKKSNVDFAQKSFPTALEIEMPVPEEEAGRRQAGRQPGGLRWWRRAQVRRANGPTRRALQSERTTTHSSLWRQTCGLFRFIPLKAQGERKAFHIGWQKTLFSPLAACFGSLCFCMTELLPIGLDAFFCQKRFYRLQN